jgi:hypothetical protein
LGLKKSNKSHPLKLGNSSITEEYSYDVGSNPTYDVVCQLKAEKAVVQSKKRKMVTVKCTLHDIYCDPDENIIGARALILLGVLVDCSKGLRKYMPQKV